ncbi:hypothetical protein [Kutzneria sp. 744]|uniref:hypothetical protein n=1 Tax=Kutzneria sp. (strain 744) TaxID=345341 RepID=UPI0003EEBC2F|nr:hypothetical protein [Kutzneria sp. 744]EWM11471.1 translation initiation factor IF-2 [Kutzneria sp. 744]
MLGAPAAHAGDGYFTSQDLTGAIAAPIGRTEPSGWSTPWDLKRHFAYVSEDRQLIVASAGPDGAWSWTVATTNGGYIFGYLATYSYTWDHSSHIVYTDASTSHLMETWSSEASPRWQTVDLTETYHEPKAKVSPRGYEQDGQQHLFFKEYDAGAIWEATFVPGTGWGFTNLTSRAGIPPYSRLSSNLAASPLGADGEAVGYIGADGYPHVLAGQHGRWIDQRVGCRTP